MKATTVLSSLNDVLLNMDVMLTLLTFHPEISLWVSDRLIIHLDHVSNTINFPSGDTHSTLNISCSVLAYIPFRDIPIKGCSTEHGSHVNTADIPSRDIELNNNNCLSD